jgi:hypothetical protein
MKSIALISLILCALLYKWKKDSLFDLISNALSAPDQNFHIYLAFGQSNMEGFGIIEAQDQQCDERFKMMAAIDMPQSGKKKHKWYTATPPICRDDTGLSPCDYFGREMVKNLPEKIKVGIINVAVAGCGIELFDEEKRLDYLSTADDFVKNHSRPYDDNPYKVLVEAGKKAKKYGVIKGILLHQGESNTGDENWPNDVKKIYEKLLFDLGLNGDKVPLLVGEVISSSVGGLCGEHNAIIAKVPNVIPNSYVVSSENLESRGDNIHFSSASYREFGKRYAQIMLGLIK